MVEDRRPFCFSYACYFKAGIVEALFHFFHVPFCKAGHFHLWRQATSTRSSETAEGCGMGRYMRNMVRGILSPLGKAPMLIAVCIALKLLCLLIEQNAVGISFAMNTFLTCVIHPPFFLLR